MRSKKHVILISLMLFLLIIKIAFPSNIVRYEKCNSQEVSQSIIIAPSDLSNSIINKDGERFNLAILNISIYSLLTITFSVVAAVFTMHYLYRRLLFEGNKKMYYIFTIYFNVGKYKDIDISSRV